MAVPAAFEDVATRVGDVADAVVTVAPDRTFLAIGKACANFQPMSDDKVVALLRVGPLDRQATRPLTSAKTTVDPRADPR